MFIGGGVVFLGSYSWPVNCPGNGFVLWFSGIFDCLTLVVICAVFVNGDKGILKSFYNPHAALSRLTC